jgi:hypothetical protein
VSIYHKGYKLVCDGWCSAERGTLEIEAKTKRTAIRKARAKNWFVGDCSHHERPAAEQGALDPSRAVPRVQVDRRCAVMRRTPLKRSTQLRASSGLNRTTRLRARGDTKYRAASATSTTWPGRHASVHGAASGSVLFASGRRAIAGKTSTLKCDGPDRGGPHGLSRGRARRPYDKTCVRAVPRHHRMRASTRTQGFSFNYPRRAARWCDALSRFNTSLQAAREVRHAEEAERHDAKKPETEQSDEGRCGAIDPRNQAKCTQPTGHVGVHANGKGYLWKDPKKAAKAKVQSLTDKCPKCKHELGEHDGNKCPPTVAASNQLKGSGYCGMTFKSDAAYTSPKLADVCTLAPGHAGPHENTSTGFKENAYTASVRETVADEGDDPLEDEIRSDDERDFARKLRETREAHEAKLAAEQPTEPAPAPAASFIRSPDRILGYRIHPVAATWPMLTESEITELGQSIKERGLHDAIILIDVDGEEFILDGRNRGHACEIVGAEPHYETYTGPATSTR